MFQNIPRRSKGRESYKTSASAKYIILNTITSLFLRKSLEAYRNSGI